MVRAVRHPAPNRQLLAAAPPGRVGHQAEAVVELEHGHRPRYAAEQPPRATARRSALLETWTELLDQTAGRSGRPLVFGRGDNPIDFVSVRDAAAAIERAVADTATRGSTVGIGGLENLTFNELAIGCSAPPDAPNRRGTFRGACSA
jgi:NADH dehydrogenase